MDDVLAELVTVARRAGIVSSVVETIDVERAAMVVGLGDRRDLRAALRACLAKDAYGRAQFDRVFDAFFAARGEAQGSLFDRLRSTGFSEAEVATLKGLVDAVVEASPDAAGLGAVASGGGALDDLIVAAGRRADLARMRSTMQVGFYTMRLLDAAGLPRVEDALSRLRDRLRDAHGARGDELADALAHELERVRRVARDYVRNELDRRERVVREEEKRHRLDQRSFTELDPSEMARVELEVKRLADRIRGAFAVRRRHDRRGALDLRKTLRHAHRTGGLPFEPIYRRRHRDKPKLVVLCDISDSVRFAAKFLLLLVHSIQEVFARTRSFVFVSEVGETTDLFREHVASRAIALAYGGHAAPVAANSNYGAVFGAFCERYLDVLDRHTTLVIVGDARNNYNDANVPALRTMRRRVRRLLWLNPEPEGSWGLGDSAMLSYAPLADVTATVHSVDTLRGAVNRLIRT